MNPYYYPWFSNDFYYGEQLSPFQYSRPFNHFPDTYYRPVGYAGQSSFLGTDRNIITQFHSDPFLNRVTAIGAPGGYWNNPTPAHPGDQEFRRRGNTIYIVKTRPRLRRKSRRQSRKIGGGHVMYVRSNGPPPSGQQTYYSASRACSINGEKKDEAKSEVDEKYEDEDEENESESEEEEEEEEVVEEEYEEEYECPYAYVDSNGKINKLHAAN
ncbi:hypothetical protein vseg_018680 [Gypsophila vaccaria]